LRVAMSLLGGLAPPHGCLLSVLGHALAVGVRYAEVVLRAIVSLLGGFAVPCETDQSVE
jgi:hypothetical protein